jgi:hypothetical protein
MGTQPNIRDQRYRTEPCSKTSVIRQQRAESDVISDRGINFFSTSEIELSADNCQSSVIALAMKRRSVGLCELLICVYTNLLMDNRRNIFKYKILHDSPTRNKI